MIKTEQKIYDIGDLDNDKVLEEYASFSNRFMKKVAVGAFALVVNSSELKSEECLDFNEAQSGFIVKIKGNEVSTEVIKNKLPADFSINANAYFVDKAFQEINERKEIINFKLKQEISNQPNYFGNDKEAALVKIEEAISQISKIGFQKISLELTPSNTIKFTMLFDSEKVLMISKPLIESKEIEENGVVFSLFIKRELVVSASKNLNELVEGINQYISM